MGQLIDDQYSVSVVIPSFNRAKTIWKALDSVLNQTYPIAEIIIVDDNSQDDTETVVNSYREKHPNITYYKHSVNRGGGAARNTGIELSKGRYIAFLDSDDEWLENKIEKQMKLVSTLKDKNIGMVYTGIYNVYINQGNRVSKYSPNRYKDIMYGLLCENFIGSTSVVLCSKEALLAIGGFDVTLPSCQDWDLYLKIAERYDVVGVEEPLIRYYIHDDSITGSSTKVITGHDILHSKINNQLQLQKKYNSRKITATHSLTLGRYFVNKGEYARARKYLVDAIKTTTSVSIIVKSLYHLIYRSVIRRSV
ncbi:glycosyltransferase family 2 protein [Paenibacillus soyae]|uniref:Glycosyltransferase n=1 Tax=Paenibacillus soyae TaxID=2969249 RepID=A0A9X2N1P7_9BACL|nr:glycosyltransferase family 2 protein [Paenibacillus soyae]MCR2807402.1 glycosyltransferase [Paenibacillus soyae]